MSTANLHTMVGGFDIFYLSSRGNVVARIGIGIDTGGTYTDAVAYDFDARTVLATAKALTTKRDLSIGIVEALDSLPADVTAHPTVISLSTTLATNACVENKIGRARLVFLGGDPHTIDSYGGEFGLPPSTEMLVQESHTTWSDGVVGEVDWERFLAAADDRLAGLDGIGVVEIFSMRNGAVVEKRAKALLEERMNVPVTCGHELVSDLNCLQRGASTLLNAGLFPVIHDFIAAIKASLAKRAIAAPVVIVRSDGNLMSGEFAALRPAETLLCGPAASVMGCMELAGEADCAVVDMGGTTSDIAIVRGGEPLRAENGIGIGNWKTYIKGLYIKTFGLGGDSALHYADRRIVLEEYRVVPLCCAASTHPGLAEQLRRQFAEAPRHTRFLHEGFILVKDVSDNPRYSEFEKRFCRALREGPLLRRRAAHAVDKDEYTLDVSRLVKEGVVQTFGLTPTDIMHITGDFRRYDREAALLGAGFVAGNLGITVEALCRAAYDEVKKRLYLNLALALLENENARRGKSGPDAAIVDLILGQYRRLRQGGGKGFIAADFKTDLPLVGIGAPIHIFLPDVAAMLGTRAVIPPHSGVANALGAVVGRVHAESVIEIRPDYNTEGITGYTVFGADGGKTFAERGDAEAFAMAEARRAACDEARRRGASGEIAVKCSMREQEGDTRSGSIYLGAKAIAHAVGSLGF